MISIGNKAVRKKPASKTCLTEKGLFSMGFSSYGVQLRILICGSHES